jgi:hypothetical protein
MSRALRTSHWCPCFSWSSAALRWACSPRLPRDKRFAKPATSLRSPMDSTSDPLFLPRRGTTPRPARAQPQPLQATRLTAPAHRAQGRFSPALRRLLAAELPVHPRLRPERSRPRPHLLRAPTRPPDRPRAQQPRLPPRVIKPAPQPLKIRAALCASSSMAALLS